MIPIMRRSRTAGRVAKSVFLRAPVLLLLVALTITACGLALGLDDVHYGDMTDATTDAPSADDSSADADDSGLGDTGDVAARTCDDASFCIPSPPFGWSRPVELQLTAPDAAADCGAGYDTPRDVRFFALDAGPAQCSACTCGAASGSVCPTNVPFQLYNENGCSTTCGSGLSAGSTCTNLSVSCANGGGFVSVGVPATTPSGGSCAAGGGGETVAAPGVTKARTCTTTLAPARATCDPGFVCAPKPSTPFATVFCVRQAGDQTCPPGYAARNLQADGITDTRHCDAGACGCGVPAGGTCAPTIQLSLGAGCSSVTAAATAPTTCSPSALDFNPASVKTTAAGSPSGMGCTPTGVAPATGGIAFTNQVTVCCTGIP